MERFEIIKDIGSGNFGVAKLVRDLKLNELYAVKFIGRGEKIDEHVQREIMNHRSLRHPNIVRFKEVFLTPTHLAIVMEYASGGEMFERICNAGRFSEDEARFFCQQLISGVSYCHSMQICHRDLKLENTLLDGSSAPRLKICDFGYSKSSVLHSQPKSTVGTPAYIAPEVLTLKEYDGKIADVWSCGVTLYVMLVGAYPFEDPDDQRNFRKTIGRILSVQYSIPDYVRVSKDCRQLLSRIFVADPDKEECKVVINKEKIMVRLKTWNKYYQEISAMLDTSGFGWDWERNVVKVDSEDVWANYVQAHPSVKHYRSKVIVNWGDLTLLCGVDGATGSHAATATEALHSINIEESADENIAENIASEAEQGSKKRKRRQAADIIADAVSSIARQMEKEGSVSTHPPPPPPPLSRADRIYAAIADLHDLTEFEIIEVINMLSINEVKSDVFMALPVQIRKTWLQMELMKLRD